MRCCHMQKSSSTNLEMLRKICFNLKLKQTLDTLCIHLNIDNFLADNHKVYSLFLLKNLLRTTL